MEERRSGMKTAEPLLASERAQSVQTGQGSHRAGKGVEVGRVPLMQR